MKFNPDIPVFGDTSYRGKCALEALEQATFVNWLRRTSPKYGPVVIHIKNEGKRNVYQAAKDKAQGMTTGASDIIIPGSPTFACEFKRRDHTKSRWQDGQQDYLLNCKKIGAFVCVALGHEAAKEAFKCWLNSQKK